MKILDEIKSIIEDKIGVPFMYQSFLKLNNWIQGEELPTVACQLIVSGGVVNEGGQHKQSADFLLIFLDHTEYEYTAVENQTIVDEQMDRLIEFLQWVDSSNVITKNGDAQIDYIYNQFDIITTGVSLRINLKELSGSTPCFRGSFDKSFDKPFIQA